MLVGISTSNNDNDSQLLQLLSVSTVDNEEVTLMEGLLRKPGAEDETLVADSAGAIIVVVVLS